MQKLDDLPVFRLFASKINFKMSSVMAVVRENNFLLDLGFETYLARRHSKISLEWTFEDVAAR